MAFVVQRLTTPAITILQINFAIFLSLADGKGRASWTPPSEHAGIEMRNTG
jgi:hypothetical protein